MLQQLRTFFAHAFQPKRNRLRLVVSHDGVALFDEDREQWQFRWESVTRIETYKRDFGVVDMIYIAFTVESGRRKCSPCDQTHGFDLLCRRLSEQFPSIAEDWWFRVAFPAFETNFSVLYEKLPT